MSFINNYYRLLNLPILCFDKENLETSVLGSFDTNKNKHWTGLSSWFSNEAISFFSKFDYKIINAELFYTPPHGELLWHIDMNPPEDFIKINFVWGSTNHVMEWGELTSSNFTPVVQKTEVNSQYIKLTEKNVSPTKKVQIHNAALVNVGRPHRVLNYSDNARWCFCMILEQNSKRINFQKAVIDLSEYVVG
jgi:hypothetical protein